MAAFYRPSPPPPPPPSLPTIARVLPRGIGERVVLHHGSRLTRLKPSLGAGILLENGAAASLYVRRIPRWAGKGGARIDSKRSDDGQLFLPSVDLSLLPPMASTPRKPRSFYSISPLSLLLPHLPMDRDASLCYVRRRGGEETERDAPIPRLVALNQPRKRRSMRSSGDLGGLGRAMEQWMGGGKREGDEGE